MRRMCAKIVMVCAVVAMTTGLAWAQAGAKKAPTPRTKTVYKAVTKVNFLTGNVKGAIDGPGMGYTIGKKATKFRALIRFRANFNRRMARRASRL